MIDHVVLLALRTGVTDADVSRFGQLLAGLSERIEGIESVRFGSSSSPEGLEQGYDYAFLITFADEQARDRYLPHPEHAPVSAMARRLSERVLVFDLTT
ncbi:Dabb family protein [Solirubrobacter taibaiensis]|nr:Dabb family protein [Solirubrobacter taibaiensis]